MEKPSETTVAAPLYHKTPNKSMRKKLALEWNTLNEEEKMILRSKRARQGLRCDICGSLGYYRENCPNACVSPPKTPDSMDSTPPSTPPPEPVGLGVFWGSDYCEETHPWNSDDTPRGKFDYLKKVDVNVVRPKAKIEQKKLEVSDAKLGSFEYFTEAEEGYARTYPELTLHQVMRRLMRLLEKQLYKNAENLEAAFDTTLLHPPFEKDRDTFYPEELTKVKEYKEYFLAKELKKDRKLMYKHQASLRPPDDLDPLFRGGSVDDRFIFSTNPKAGQSMHGKNTWKSVLSHSDDLASSDPMMAKKQAKIDKLFHDQSKWIQMQQRSMTHRNDRYEHLVNILKNELAQEHKREGRALLTSKHGSKSVQLELWLERLESVDTIMNCVKLYNFSSGLEEADFLMFCFDRWKQTIRKQVARHGGSTAAATLIGKGNSNSNSNGGGGGGGGKADKDSGGGASVASGSTRTSHAGKGGGPLQHNKLISSSSPYHADMVAINEQEKKTRKMRDKFLAEAKITRAREAVKLEQLMAKEAAAAAAEAAAKKASSSGVVSGKKEPAGGAVLHFAPSVEVIAGAGTSSSSGLDHDAEVIPGGSLTGSAPPPSLSRGYSQGALSTVSNSPNPSRRPSLLRKQSSYGSDLTSVNTHSSGGGSVNSPTPSGKGNAKAASVVVTQADLVDQSVQAALQFTEDMKRAADLKKQHKKLMTTSRAVKNFTVVHRKHPREIDDEKIARAKQTFISADLKDHIRKGNDSDLACIAPSLIPVPEAFDGDGRNPMSSYTAENIVWKVKKNMIIGDLGYMPRSMVPLYVRNTLIEKNGTSKGGDQTYDMMSTDRRYTHYMGRPLNRFEEFSNEEVADVSQTGSSGYGTMIKSRVTKHSLHVEDNSGATRERLRRMQLVEAKRASTAELEAQQREQQRAARHQMREERRRLQVEMDQAKETPLSSSLVRMVFKNPEPDLRDLNYLDEY